MNPVVIGISLKLYLGHRQTLDWFDRVLDIAERHPALRDGATELFVLPGLTELAAVAAAARGSVVAVGAQDLFWDDRGAYTGEVSGAVLREIGCTYAEVGHAERRRLFGEDDDVVVAKAAAAMRNGLRPVVCVGEELPESPDAAVRTCLRQLDPVLRLGGPITVAYEPVWAIGADEPAPGYHVSAVCAALREHIGGLPGSRVIYGGSAGPGLLTALRHSVDGLFLGRFAHDPTALEFVLDEVVGLRT